MSVSVNFTEAFNLLLERLDQLIQEIRRIADAMEEALDLEKEKDE